MNTWVLVEGEPGCGSRSELPAQEPEKQKKERKTCMWLQACRCLTPSYASSLRSFEEALLVKPVKLSDLLRSDAASTAAASLINQISLWSLFMNSDPTPSARPPGSSSSRILILQDPRPPGF